MTLIESIRNGKIPKAVTECAQAEHCSEETLAQDIEKGFTVIPRNCLRTFTPCAVGKNLKTKVNANIGTSSDHLDLDEEMDKLHAALDANADSIMDLSTGGDLNSIREEMLSRCPVMFGTVPLYQVWSETIQNGRDIHSITSDSIFNIIETQAKQGVDYMTLHCGITRETIRILHESDRVGGMVSKGGALIAAWIKNHKQENPLFEEFGRLLDIAYEYDITLSLGDGLRPGAIADAGDKAQIAELELLGSLQKKALAHGVQVMIEGPGHVPLHMIAEQVRQEKEVCSGAPFYVLGPLTCDIAPGYDHITSAIGGAIAAAAGADFLCYVTPAEHLRLPTVEDVRNGVIAARIAAHSGDIAKGIPHAAEYDREFSTYRQELNWNRMYEMAIDPQLAIKYRKESEDFDQDKCTMCGDLCAVKMGKGK
ncbi:phosphomethylpyrimidine synthase ThiC [Planctomycetota bacterium]